MDLRELQGQERLDVLCGFLRAIGRRLGKPVVMTPEGDWEHRHPVLGFDVVLWDDVKDFFDLEREGCLRMCW